jgi:N-acyl-L-homoserine lactone synthetase
MRDPRAKGGPCGYHATIFEAWQFPDAALDFQRFRKRLFVDQLGWALTCKRGIERDEFDTPNVIYGLIFSTSGIVGGWRAIRTTEEYLGRKLFPQLATLRPYPNQADVWEISRLGVMPGPDRQHAARCTYALMVQFAQTRRATALVGVVDVTHGRNIRVAGIKLRRRGIPELVATDRKGHPIIAYVAELRPGDQCGAHFHRLMGHLNGMEIKDEAYLRGPRRVSA